MECGYEALPPRETGRGSKRKRAAAATGAVSKQVEVVSASALPAREVALPPPSYDGVASEMTYEYLDHTADVQIHSWAPTLEGAFVQAALGMFGYMTEPDKVEVDPECSRIIEARGHDYASLLFNFLDACLYAFASDDFVAKDMRALELSAPPLPAPSAGAAESRDAAGEAADAAAAASSACGDGSPGYRLRAVAWGERFSLSKHPQGTEIKAITYSAMQIFTPTHLFTAGVAPTTLLAAAGGAEPAAAASAAAASEPPVGASAEGDGAEDQERVAGGSAAIGVRRAAFDVYVIVDI